jgi:hypothetical protein
LGRDGAAFGPDVRVRHTGEGVAVVEFTVVEHLLVVVDDVVLARALLNLPGTGDTRPLSAGVGEVPAVVLAGFEDGLVVGDFDGLALLDELDVEVLDFVFGDVGWTGLLDGLFAALFEFGALRAGAGSDGGGRATADGPVHRLREVRLGDRLCPTVQHLL